MHCTKIHWYLNALKTRWHCYKYMYLCQYIYTSCNTLILFTDYESSDHIWTLFCNTNGPKKINDDIFVDVKFDDVQFVQHNPFQYSTLEVCHYMNFIIKIQSLFAGHERTEEQYLDQYILSLYSINLRHKLWGVSL